MRTPIFVRPLTEVERGAVEAGLRSSDAFTMRRCQILLASSRGERATHIARSLSCNDQTVRNAIKAFNLKGAQALQEGSSRPHTIERAFSEESVEAVRGLLHRSPRDFNKPTSVWTLALVAQVSFEQGLTQELVSAETVRATLERLRVRWLRAKEWIVSPDPQYARKKSVEIG
jgi:Winged helix-turn helix